jgi:hypothetical protein
LFGSWANLPRHELISLTAGTGSIEVRGNAPSICLFVNGRPISANWGACSGSILEYFYLKEPHSIEEKADVVRALVAHAPPLEQSLAERFGPFLRLFPPGLYRLQYQEEGNGLYFHQPEYTSIRWSDINSSTLWHVGSDTLAAGVRELLPSQNTDRFDEARVLDWAIAIEAGDRPTAITATIEGANCEFILDGHHKLRGYLLADVPIRRLAITHLEAAPLRQADWPGGRLADPPSSWLRVTIP